MIPRPARLIAALLLSGVATAHSQALHPESASACGSGDLFGDSFREVHLLCRSVVDGRLVGSESGIVDPTGESGSVPEIPERITGGCFQQIRNGDEWTGTNLPFEGLTEFLWVRTDGVNGSLKSFATALREAEVAKSSDAERSNGAGMVTWPAGGIKSAEGVVHPGVDAWDFQIQEAPEPSAMILIALSYCLLLTRRQVCK